MMLDSRTPAERALIEWLRSVSEPLAMANGLQAVAHEALSSDELEPRIAGQFLLLVSDVLREEAQPSRPRLSLLPGDDD